MGKPLESIYRRSQPKDVTLMGMAAGGCNEIPLPLDHDSLDYARNSQTVRMCRDGFGGGGLVGVGNEADR
jgi:hypothetical protein